MLTPGLACSGIAELTHTAHLPTPVDVHVAPVLSGVDVHMATREDVDAWAEALGATPTDDGPVHHALVVTRVGGHPVRLDVWGLGPLTSGGEPR